MRSIHFSPEHKCSDVESGTLKGLDSMEEVLLIRDPLPEQLGRGHIFPKN